MSIEDSIAQIAAALNNIADALRRGHQTDVSITVASPAVEEVKVEEKKVEKTTKAAATQTAVSSKTTAEKAPPAADVLDESAPTYDEAWFKKYIQAPIVKMAAVPGSPERAKAVEILTGLGVKKASELKVSQYAEAARLIAESLSEPVA